MDFWGGLLVVFVLGFLVVLPAATITLVAVAVGRGSRLKALEASHGRLEARLYELGARLRKLEGAPATSSSTSPAPAPADASTVSRLREHVRAPAETASAGAGRGESPLTPPPASGVVRIESDVPGAPVARAVNGPLPPDARAARVDASPEKPSATAPAAATFATTTTPGASSSEMPRPRAHVPPPPPPPKGPAGGSSGAGASGVPLERIVGVLITAGIGAVALGLAGLLFFQFAVKAGWIGPELRVILGTALGVAAVAGSSFLHRKTPAAANALSAGGVVVLYASFWASHVRYHLVPMELAFALMALVTAVTALLADRRKSPLTAVLGIAGGFATPVLLTSGSNRPIELFTYVLLLDAAFLWVAWRRRWAFLSVIALVGSLLLQGLWLGTRMEPSQLWLGLGITGVFAAVFAATGRLSNEKDRWQWGIAQAGGVIVPFGFAMFLASQRELGGDFVPHAVLLAFLSVAASWLGRAWKNPVLPLGAAAGALGTLAAFAIAQRGDLPPWETVAIAAGLAAIFHFFSERDADAPAHTIVPASFAALGFGFLVTVFSAVTPIEDPWPWLAGFAALGAMLLRQSRSGKTAALALVPAFCVPVAIAIHYVAHHSHAGFPPLPVFMVIGAAAAAAFQAVSFFRRDDATRRMNDHAAALFSVAWVAFLPLLAQVAGSGAATWRYAAVALATSLLAMLAAVRLRSGAWLLAATIGLVFAQSFTRPGVPAFALLGAGVLLATAWPFLFPRSFRGSYAAWISSAIAAVVWFLPLRHQWLAAFGERAIGALPLLLAMSGLAGAFGVRALFIDEREARSVRAREPERRPSGIDRAAAMRRDLLALFGAVALGFVALAVPLQLDKQWITVAWALQGVAVLWLWTKLDHAGLKWFGLVLLGAVTVRLTLNVAVPGYHPREIPVVNWILYTYWVPAIALLAARSLLAKREVARLREWEEPIYPANVALGAGATSLAAIGVIFVWINLAIADWFSAGDAVLWTWAREPGRDVAMSIAWAVYGLVLLGIGMARKSGALRWVSLAVLLLAIAKVFLYDLGELQDLYRVLSLLGLALSLILVSFGYQRFVFRRPLEGTT